MRRLLYIRMDMMLKKIFNTPEKRMERGQWKDIAMHVRGALLADQSEFVSRSKGHYTDYTGATLAKEYDFKEPMPRWKSEYELKAVK